MHSGNIDFYEASLEDSVEWYAHLMYAFHAVMGQGAFPVVTLLLDERVRDRVLGSEQMHQLITELALIIKENKKDTLLVETGLSLIDKVSSIILRGSSLRVVLD